MGKLEDLSERVDRLVLRHQELKRASTLIEQQLAAVTAERDSLKSRLAAATVLSAGRRSSSASMRARAAATKRDTA
jgi:hypothetical protein